MSKDTVNKSAFKKKIILLFVILLLIPYSGGCTIQYGLPMPIYSGGGSFDFFDFFVDIIIFAIILNSILKLLKDNKNHELILKINSGLNFLLVYLAFYLIAFIVLPSGAFDNKNLGMFLFPLVGVLFPGLGQFGSEYISDIQHVHISILSMLIALSIVFFIGFKNLPITKKNFMKILIIFLLYSAVTSWFIFGPYELGHYIVAYIFMNFVFIATFWPFF